MHQNAPEILVVLPKNSVTSGSTFCKLLLIRYLYMVPFKIMCSLQLFAKTTSAIVSFVFVFTLLLLLISPSLYCVTVCAGSDGCVHLFVCFILICFYIPSLYAALHLFLFFYPPSGVFPSAGLRLV